MGKPVGTVRIKLSKKCFLKWVSLHHKLVVKTLTVKEFTLKMSDKNLLI